MTAPEQQPAQPLAPRPAKPRRRRLRQAGLLTLAAALLSLILGVGVALYMVGRPVTAPDWVRARIEARIAQALPQARVSFGEIVFIVDEGWRPRVRLRDVSLLAANDTEIVGFNEFKASLSMRSLLNGQVQPRDIAVSGVFVTLRRGTDGRVSLSAGSGAAPPQREAATLPQLIGQIDAVFQTPALSALNAVEVRALTLRYEDLLAQRAWTVDGGRLRLSRSGDALTIAADLAVLGGGAGVATLEASYSSRIGETAATFGVSFDGVAAADIAAQGPAFAWLDVLRAPISGAVRSGINADGQFAPINATLQIGKGVVQPNDRTEPITFDGARSYFTYDPARQLLRFDELSLRSKWVSGLATGTATLGVTDGTLGDLVAQFKLTEISANPDNLFADPVTLASADLDLQLRLDPFRLQLGRLEIADQGQTLIVDGSMQADPAGWRMALDARLDGLRPDRLLTFWPERIKPKTRKWIVENLNGGKVTDIDLALRRAPGERPETYLAFDFQQADVRFMKTMPSVTGGSGHFSLAANRLVVTLDAGQVLAPEGGAVALTGSSFIIPDVTVKDGAPSVIRLETRSTVTAMLALLNQPPLQTMDKAGMPVTVVDGQAVLHGTLAVPLKKGVKPSAVRYHVEGDLLSLRSDTLVKGRSLRAARLGVQVDNEGLNISGKAKLDDVAFDGSWAQPIGAGANQSTLRGNVTLNQAALDAFGVALPPGTVAGSGTGRIAIDFTKGRPPAFSLESDLTGLRVAVPQLNWTKQPATSGALRIAGQLGTPPKIDTLQVSAPGLSARGSVRLASNGTLDRVRFDRVERGGWLDVPVDLVGRGAGKPLQVVLRGGMLDLRQASFGAANATNAASPPMLLSLDRLQITDTIALTGMSGEFSTNSGLDGAFQARLNGGTPVQGRVVPQSGRSAIRLTATDAGGVLRSAGLLKQVVGGDLSLVLLPVGSGGAFDGRLTVHDVRIRDAPGIAGLVNAVSVVGLINELNGDGIYFDDVEADFRMTDDLLTLTKASAVGASMGLSMDGVYGLKTGLIKMQGVFTPVYLLNGIGSVLTRKGEGLFGFNYALTGPAKSPSVSVNPLSALAPGMFREIFRRAPPELPQVDGVTGSTLPAPRPAPRKPVVRPFTGR